MEDKRFWQTEQFAAPAMAEFMRRPEIYWALNDPLAPAPEQINYEEWLLDPKIWTVACMFERHVVGFVQFQARTSIGAELTVGFHPQARGKIAALYVRKAIAAAWKTRSYLSIWSLVAQDNKVARLGCRVLGFQPEGRLRMAIMRADPPGIQDIIIYALHRPEILT